MFIFFFILMFIVYRLLLFLVIFFYFNFHVFLFFYFSFSYFYIIEAIICDFVLIFFFCIYVLLSLDYVKNLIDSTNPQDFRFVDFFILFFWMNLFMLLFFIYLYFVHIYLGVWNFHHPHHICQFINNLACYFDFGMSI